MTGRILDLNPTSSLNLAIVTDETKIPEPARRTTKEVVGRIDDLDQQSMKMVSVGKHKVALIRTSSGVHALDNACPHQGYGLVTGALDDGTITCQWHNWKFDVATGQCLIGEEDVPCHRVTIDQGEIERIRFD